MPGVMPLSTDQRTVASDRGKFATDVNLSDGQKNILRGILERRKNKTKDADLHEAGERTAAERQLAPNWLFDE